MTNTFSTTDIKAWDIESIRHVSPLIKELLPLLPPSLRIVDVGSNIGKFIELLSTSIDIEDAILIEPVTELLEYSQSKFPQYKFLNCLVSKCNGPLHLYVPATYSNLGISRVMQTHLDMVPPNDLRTLDSISLTYLLTEMYPDFSPNLIKIDAEGMDLDIVEGLFKYVKEALVKPIIVFECNWNSDITKIKEDYYSIGYKLYGDRDQACSRDEFLIPPTVT